MNVESLPAEQRRAALEALHNLGRPEGSRLLVIGGPLGHRELPSEPDFCGRSCPPVGRRTSTSASRTWEWGGRGCFLASAANQAPSRQPVEFHRPGNGRNFPKATIHAGSADRRPFQSSRTAKTLPLLARREIKRGLPADVPGGEPPPRLWLTLTLFSLLAWGHWHGPQSCHGPASTADKAVQGGFDQIATPACCRPW